MGGRGLPVYRRPRAADMPVQCNRKNRDVDDGKKRLLPETQRCEGASRSKAVADQWQLFVRRGCGDAVVLPDLDSADAPKAVGGILAPTVQQIGRFGGRQLVKDPGIGKHLLWRVAQPLGQVIIPPGSAGNAARHVHCSGRDVGGGSDTERVFLQRQLQKILQEHNPIRNGEHT